jgi:hypothetical protein
LFIHNNTGKHKLPVHLWQGKMADKTAPVSEHSFGKGRVIWFPSNIALGAWVSDNFKPLSDYLYETLPNQLKPYRLTDTMKMYC